MGGSEAEIEKKKSVGLRFIFFFVQKIGFG